MGNQSMYATQGYKCPVRGCLKKKRLFSLGGIYQHILYYHGVEEIKKRLRIKK